MSLLDAFELLDFLELVRSWRFALCTAVGIGAGYIAYAALGQGRPAMAAGGVIFLGGLIWGIVWQADHERINR